jgi:deoxyribodipyrimidine photo-lyase
MQPVILWFRRNLRLADNAALIAAAESGQPIIPVYVLDKQDAGGAGRWWLHYSLASLDHDLKKLGSDLILRSGQPDQVLGGLAEEAGATSIYYACRYEPESRRQEEALHAAVQGRLSVHASGDGLLQHPTRVLTAGGSPYRIFTPYWKEATATGEPAEPRAVPSSLSFDQRPLTSLQLDELKLLPSTPDWAGGLCDTWTPGESGALQRIDELESIVQHYGERRNRPDMDATSRLSPHLHFGEISVRQLWHSLRKLDMRLRATAGTEALLRQLYWREFSTYLLFHFPDLPDKPLRSEFEMFPWAGSAGDLSAWQQGMTGYPIVDAGMRQLWATGWMHNRVRMVAASFLVKDLLIPWQEGAAWFLDTLVDADLANNSAGWQWVAGCGTDAAPFFRIFNPTLQGQKFDPQGDYVQRWVPEFDRNDYPAPVVDHAVARQRALEAYQSIKGMRASKHAPRSFVSSSVSRPS